MVEKKNTEIKENKKNLTKEGMEKLKLQLKEAQEKTTNYAKKNPFKVAGAVAVASAVAGGVAGFLLGKGRKKK